MPWETVSDEEAIELKYYGVRGWLRFFYVLAVISFVFTVYNLVNPEPITLMIFAGNARIVQALYLLSLVLQIPFLVLTPIAHPLMPSATIVCTWVYMVFVITLTSNLDATFAAMNAETMSPDFAAAATKTAVIVNITMTALWTWYLLSSKRVNVTYRNRVRDWEQVLRSR